MPEESSFSKYKNNDAIPTAANTKVVKGTSIEGRNEAPIIFSD
jgi:hypothetical protein